ncbi:MAG TPA: hypothetical protein VFV34_08115 [Blastocatellia bacterium]|nr:hypothetical protein [Blastocatellia bacterium]
MLGKSRISLMLPMAAAVVFSVTVLSNAQGGKDTVKQDGKSASAGETAGKLVLSKVPWDAFLDRQMYVLPIGCLPDCKTPPACHGWIGGLMSDIYKRIGSKGPSEVGFLITAEKGSDQPESVLIKMFTGGELRFSTISSADCVKVGKESGASRSTCLMVLDPEAQKALTRLSSDDTWVGLKANTAQGPAKVTISLVRIPNLQ